MNEHIYVKNKEVSPFVPLCTPLYKNNMVIAVSPIYHARNFNSLLDLKQVIAIELQDLEEHIFERIVFSDEDDNVYKDDAYKE